MSSSREGGPASGALSPFMSTQAGAPKCPPGQLCGPAGMGYPGLGVQAGDCRRQGQGLPRVLSERGGSPPARDSRHVQPQRQALSGTPLGPVYSLFISWGAAPSSQFQEPVPPRGGSPFLFLPLGHWKNKALFGAHGGSLLLQLPVQTIPFPGHLRGSVG